MGLCREFGPDQVGLSTGDATVNRDASILCCTAEVLANIALREGPEAAFDDVVMDEFHYYADRDRGVAWQLPPLTMPQAQFCASSNAYSTAHDAAAGLELLFGVVRRVAGQLHLAVRGRGLRKLIGAPAPVVLKGARPVGQIEHVRRRAALHRDVAGIFAHELLHVRRRARGRKQNDGTDQDPNCVCPHS
jgi:hypothetical protein